MENKTLIFEALANIMQEVKAVEKGKDGPGYKFRGIDDMYNALHPLFSKQKVVITSEVLATEREERQTKSGTNIIYAVLTVRFTYHAQDGSSISSIMIGEAMDVSDKATNKAMSNALKYALMQTFLIPTTDLEEMEMDRQKHEPIHKTSIQTESEALAFIEKCKKDEDLNNVLKAMRPDIKTLASVIEAGKKKRADINKK